MPDDLVHVRLESDDFSCDDVQIYEIAGNERLGRLFEIAISVVTTAPEGLDLTAVEGATATLVFQVDQQDVRRLHGMIAAIDDYLDTQPDTRSYRLLLVPRAHRLTLVRTHARDFHGSVHTGHHQEKARIGWSWNGRRRISFVQHVPAARVRRSVSRIGFGIYLAPCRA